MCDLITSLLNEMWLNADVKWLQVMSGYSINFHAPNWSTCIRSIDKCADSNIAHTKPTFIMPREMYPRSILSFLLLCTVIINVLLMQQDKAGTKARLGTNQVKETVQEYIAGAETVTDDPATRDYVVVRARLMAAK